MFLITSRNYTSINEVDTKEKLFYGSVKNIMSTFRSPPEEEIEFNFLEFKSLGLDFRTRYNPDNPLSDRCLFVSLQYIAPNRRACYCRTETIIIPNDVIELRL